MYLESEVGVWAWQPSSMGSDRPAETLKGPPAQPLGPSGVLLSTVGQEGP